ncbi:MAG: divalent-cation tolerance protein CutA [Deltaproteobacteria bacterium]|nr:divalent-cation tolerance protein CutA [Deltaproteobacteria bacterium]
MTDVRVVLVTVPSQAAGERIAEALVGEQLAACVNIVGPIRSIYRWQGELCRDDEHLLLIKTTAAAYAALETRVRALHGYDNPEIIALPVEMGAAAYLEWVTKSVTGDQ